MLVVDQQWTRKAPHRIIGDLVRQARSRRGLAVFGHLMVAAALELYAESSAGGGSGGAAGCLCRTADGRCVDGTLHRFVYPASPARVVSATVRMPTVLVAISSQVKHMRRLCAQQCSGTSITVEALEMYVQHRVLTAAIDGAWPGIDRAVERLIAIYNRRYWEMHKGLYIHIPGSPWRHPRDAVGARWTGA